jgi:hypothetical protein
VTVDGLDTFTLREVCPRDFYWFALLENEFSDTNPVITNLQTLAMLMEGDETDLMLIPKRAITPLMWWMSKNLLDEKVMKLDQWYEMAFHLCKQRFDASMDWMETQPISKILLMTQVLTKHAKEQEREMRKASRKK